MNKFDVIEKVTKKMTDDELEKVYLLCKLEKVKRGMR